MVMPANSATWLVHYWQGLYGGLGHLYTPERKEVGYPHIPHAIDPGTYSYACRGQMGDWDPDRYMRMLDWAATQPKPPLWVGCPDWPFSWSISRELWHTWRADVAAYGWPVALVVQDGATVEEVRTMDADVIFVGGSTDWKWATVADWAAAFPRVHIGRCNSPAKLYELYDLGIESCDGTGWFRGKAPQVVGLEEFLRWQADPTRSKPLVGAASRRGVAMSAKQGSLW